jgi:RHS repeat-associated protein
MSRSYNFGLGTSDNGNVNSITNCRDTNRTQNFTYDAFNRIQTAYTSGPNWGEDFTIDAWGNLTNRALHSNKNTFEPLSQAALGNNQLTGFGYDAAGNMTTNGSQTYTYDVENHMTKFVGVSTNNYSYDGDGRRVKKTGPVALYWYGATGSVLDETGSAGALTSEYIFFNGKRVARRDADNSVKYYFSDHLGSASAVTSSVGTITAESDYYPYGGEIVVTSGDTNHYKFTGKERDAESGLDYFGARHYASSLGRFMTPDWAAKPTAVPYAMFGNPQSLNLYSYVENSPETLDDPDGHGSIDASTYATGEGFMSYGVPSWMQQWQIQAALQARQRPAAQNTEVNKKAAVIYGETSGLSPEVGKDGKSDPKSATQLQDARENIADVSERNRTVHAHKPSAKELKNPQATKAWEDSQRAARASDGSKPGRYFFIRQAGEGPQHPSERAGFGQGDPIREYGPFRNSGGGDVPRGDQTYVDIYDK